MLLLFIHPPVAEGVILVLDVGVFWIVDGVTGACATALPFPPVVSNIMAPLVQMVPGATAPILTGEPFTH